MKDMQVMTHVVRIARILGDKFKAIDKRLDDHAKLIGEVRDSNITDVVRTEVAEQMDEKVNEFESMIDDKFDDFSSSYTFTTAVEELIRDTDISDQIADAVHDADIRSMVRDEFDSFDLSDRIRDEVREYDFSDDVERIVNAKLKPIIDKMVQDAVRNALINAANNITEV